MQDVPEILILGWRIQEPMTALTDWLITLASFVFSFKLNRRNHKLAKTYALFFLLMGTSTLFGGTAHAFNYEFGRAFHRIPWLFSGLATYSFMLASNLYFRARGMHRVWEWTPHVFIVLFIIAIFNTLSFAAVGIGTAVGFLLYVLPLHLKFNRPSAGRKEFFIGLTLLLISAIVAALKIGVSQWFNHNDIGHLLLIAALYQFYKRALIQSQEAP